MAFSWTAPKQSEINKTGLHVQFLSEETSLNL